MTAIESLSCHRRGGLLSPASEHVPRGTNCSLSTPQSMKRTFDLSTGLFVGLIHFQIDVGRGSEILTRSVDRSWIRKSAYVFVHCLRFNRSGSHGQTPEDLV